MKRILISDWIPEEALKKYKDNFEIFMPSREKMSFSYDEILNIINEVDAFFVLDSYADKKLIENAKALKAIVSFGVGYNSIDVDSATERGIAVLNTPTSATEATAEHTVALMMATLRGIAAYDRQLRSGHWESPNFSDLHDELYGRILGILGFGRIGKMVCKKARGLGMKVIYYDKFRADEKTERQHEAEYCSFDDVVSHSDILTLHMPYIPENHHIINQETFKKMKTSAYLINAARGALINEKELAIALENREIKGAGLDVFENEPDIEPALLKLENVTLTPHAASLTMKVRLDMCEEGLHGIEEIFMGNKPSNIVNSEIF